MTRGEVAAAWPDFATDVILDTSLMPIRDQGHRGTCLAFAMSAAHEHCRAPGQTLSTEYLYWASKQRDGRPQDEGTTIVAAMAALQDDGQPREAAWPYDPNRLANSQTYSPPPLSRSDLYRRTSTAPAVNQTRLATALSAGKMPVLAIAITTPFIRALDGRIDPSPAHVEGYHAVVAIAAGQQPALGFSIIVRNSWSDTWGVRGHALVPTAYLTNHLIGLIILD